MSKAPEGFAAKLAPKYDGPFTVANFVSPVIPVLRHAGTKKKKNSKNKNKVYIKKN